MLLAGRCWRGDAVADSLRRECHQRMYGHGLSERSLAKRLSPVPPRIHKRKGTVALPPPSARLQRQNDVRELRACTASVHNSLTTLASGGLSNWQVEEAAWEACLTHKSHVHLHPKEPIRRERLGPSLSTRPIALMTGGLASHRVCATVLELT